MTNEEKILQQLEALNQEIRDIKSSVQPYIELKNDLQPIISDLMMESVQKLEGLGRDFKIEQVASLMGQIMASSKHLTEALQSLNRFMEFKNDVSGLIKPTVDGIVAKLEDLQQKGVFQVFLGMLDLLEDLGTRMSKDNLSQAKPVKGVFGLMSALKEPEVQEGLGVMFELLKAFSILKKT